jgi:N-acetylglutamate synthase
VLRVIIDADVVAAALADTWEHLASALPGAWTIRDGGVIAWVSGVSLPTLNGVWAERADADPAVAAQLLDQAGATGLPYCLELRPGASPALSQLASASSMSLAEELPLMVAETPGDVSDIKQPAGLVIRQLAPEEAGLHAQVAAAGFEAPVDLFRQLMTADVMRLPGVRVYVGSVGDEAVTTGMGITLGRSVGVFSIATPPQYRRHGYGAAVTARAMADGVAAGASWSWLQSSQIGYATYGRLGFRTVETWPCWISAGQHD